MVRVRVRVFVRVRVYVKVSVRLRVSVRVRVSYDCPVNDCPGNLIKLPGDGNQVPEV